MRGTNSPGYQQQRHQRRTRDNRTTAETPQQAGLIQTVIRRTNLMRHNRDTTTETPQKMPATPMPATPMVQPYANHS